MARRRLTPPPADVPHAERPDTTTTTTTATAAHGFDAGPGAPAGPAPIARVVAEASGAAAAEELAEVLRQARDEGRMVLDIPLGAISPDHLTRDRLPVEDEEMAALRESLRLHGQRAPIEVVPLAGALPYGLVSGWRRLAALKALSAETLDPRFSTIRALVRRPEGAAAAYVAMVEENELRVGLSQYERARVAALAAARGVFPDEEAALRALFATASRPKRSRIRAFVELWRALDGDLRFPAQLPERLGLRLVEAVRTGQGPRLAAALAAADPATPEAERAALEAALAPPRAAAARPAPTPLRPGVAIEERLTGRTLTLRLTGEGVTPALAAEVRALIERLRAG